MENYKLFDAEYRLMCIIWEQEPINSTQLSRLTLEKLGWKKSTTYNMIRKLQERRIIQNQDAVVTALVKQEEVQKYESETLVEKNFNGSLPAFLTTFLGGKKLSAKEAEEIKQIIEGATK